VDGQPVECGKPLPLLARFGRARKPAEATGTRRSDGRVVNIWRTLGMREPGPPDPMADDAPGWRRDWWR
jgi:hypothetical protein